MKYVFFFSLLYKHFKKPCSFRIYLDDVMVDEVVLDKDINPIKDFKEKYVDESDGWDQYPGQQHRFFQIYQNLDPQLMSEKIWIYHLDLQDNNRNIFLDFDINDSDYTNGFMTRSAQVMFTRAGLMKESLFNKSRDFFKKRMENINRKFFRPGRPRYKTIKPEDLMDEFKYKRVIARHQPVHMFRYPAIDNFVMQSKNSADVEEESLPPHWRGGDFLVKLNLVKKYNNMILQEGDRPVKGVVDFDAYVCWLKQIPEVINISK